MFADNQRPIIHYHQLPFGGATESSWEDGQLRLSPHGSIKAFSANFRTNLLAVLTEEWIENTQ